jgi:hypothetical protein
MASKRERFSSLPRLRRMVGIGLGILPLGIGIGGLDEFQFQPVHADDRYKKGEEEIKKATEDWAFTYKKYDVDHCDRYTLKAGDFELYLVDAWARKKCEKAVEEVQKGIKEGEMEE